jgi:hypothetical protein
MTASVVDSRFGAARLRACVALAALSLATLAALAQAWAPNETLVSAQGDMIDLEFNQNKALLAWNSDDGKLWIASVDRRTGAFVPADGKGILADSDTMTFQDAQKTKNGPEWASGITGDFIVYTKYAGRHTDGNSRIGVAQQAPDGGWSGGFLGPDSAVRKAPYGSFDAGDPAPRITYVDNREVHYWRDLWNPATEQAITDFPASNYPIRHVRGARAVAYPLATPSGVEQIFYRNLDTGVVEQLTFDAGNKYEVWMWQAPEFGNEFVFMTLVDQIELRVYRKLPTGAAGALQWTPIFSRTAPSGNKIFSPEPFVWNAKSYVFMSQSVKPNKFRSQIWIANIDSAAPIFRRITDNKLLRTRTDPEVFITSNGPRIYYNRLVPDTGSGRPRSCRNPSCSEGVWMSDPGPL